MSLEANASRHRVFTPQIHTAFPHRFPPAPQSRPAPRTPRSRKTPSGPSAGPPRTGCLPPASRPCAPSAALPVPAP
eukprot:2569024-Prymnesium_polylepis.1